MTSTRTCTSLLSFACLGLRSPLRAPARKASCQKRQKCASREQQTKHKSAPDAGTAHGVSTASQIYNYEQQLLYLQQRRRRRRQHNTQNTTHTKHKTHITKHKTQNTSTNTKHKTHKTKDTSRRRAQAQLTESAPLAKLTVMHDN